MISHPAIETQTASAGQMNRRKHIPIKVKLAAALLALGDIPHSESQAMSAHAICRRYEWDHYPIRKADGGSDHPSNLTPRLLADHRAKTAKIDLPEIAKSKRIGKDWQDFVKRNFGVKKRPPPPSRWPKRRMSNA